MSLRLSPAKVVGTIVVLCAALAGPSEARAAIAYGGPATVAFNPASYSVGFTTGGATSATTTVTAVLSGGPVSQAVGVSYTYTVPPALGGGVGYNVTGILNFPVGQTTASFNVTLYNPQSVGSQAITVQLSAVTGPASVGTPSTATINVVTSGPPATVQFSAATYCVQGGSSVPIVVTLANGPVAQDVSFSYASGGGTAVAGSDYLAVSGTGTIPAGQSSFSFSVTSINDPAGGSVNLNLTLSNLTGPATLGSPSTATLTINDVVISVAFSAASYTQAASTSGSTPATIAVNLTGGPVDEAVTFSYATVAGGSAVAGVDYTAVNGTGTIPAGQSSTAFSVLVSPSGRSRLGIGAAAG